VGGEPSARRAPGAKGRRRLDVARRVRGGLGFPPQATLAWGSAFVPGGIPCRSTM
jgi:hypothetical protein